MSFAHLHVHTEYSLLDGFSNIRKLISRVKEMGMKSVAITDHGTMFGVIEFFLAAREQGIKPVIGLEAYVSARNMSDRDPQKDKHSYHLVLLAENEKGYRNLLSIASAGQLDGFYYNPRVDHAFLEQHSEGLIATSSCMSGEVPRTILNRGLEAGNQALEWYINTFGANNFFIELQDHEIRELPGLNRQLVELGKQYQLNFIATNDVHYINPEDWYLQDIMLAIQTGSLLSDQNRMKMSGRSYYLRSPQEMAQLFGEIPGALSNTLAIAERCELDLVKPGYHLPIFSVPDGYTTQSFLRKLCEEGIEQLYGSRAQDPEIRQRLDYELDIIHTMGFDAYFLIVWDLCRFACENKVWYNTRGSGAGSIVAYSLNITLIDPLKHKLLFERFLNPGRISMPDIDLDFQDDKRSLIMDYCARQYGSDKVAQIITFGTLGAKAAIRDVGRVKDIPLSEVDRIAKAVPNAIPDDVVTLATSLEKCPEFKAIYDEGGYVQELIDTASKMEGVARNAGTHAAGVVITDIPLLEYLPLHRPTNNAEDSPIKVVTQFEMNMIATLGLLKVDFLGLSTLTIMQRACDLIAQRHGVELNLHNIPLDDAETYEFLSKGHTAGVFQLEGSGMTRYLTQMKPRDLSNIIAMVALYRPGPMEFIPKYIKRMHNEEPVTYSHETLERVFKETYGLPVYQEQLMMAVMELAGYTTADADDLRKAISKKLKHSIEKHKNKFIKGAQTKGMDADTARAIFEDWENFARYGFNKSHAADYGMIAVETAYLKRHYAVEFMTALLSVSKNDLSKVAFYVADARVMGIEVLPPDVNTSGWDFTIEDCADGKSGIRFGLGAVKNVGQAPVEMILEARNKGAFSDLNDFVRRVDLHKVGKRSLECLIRVGALDSFGQRVALLEAMDSMISISGSHFRAADCGQLSIFGSVSGVEEDIHLPSGLTLDRRQQLEWEKELIGLYVSDHPISPYLPLIREKATYLSNELAELPQKKKVVVAGMVVRIRPHVTKKGDPMGFASIEDIQGNIDLVIFPRSWEKHGPLVQMESVILVEGEVDNANGDPKVLVNRITPLKESDILAVEIPPVSSPLAGRLIPGESWQVDLDTARFIQNENDFEEPPLSEEEASWQSAPSPEVTMQTDTATLAEEPAVTSDPIAGEQETPTDMIREREPAAPYPTVQEEILVKPPVIAAPRPLAAAPGERIDTRMITVTITSTGEKDRDIRRMKRVHGLLNSYPGRDHFCFLIHERGYRHLLDFPNDSTNASGDLIARLSELVGRDNVQVEYI